jgi:acetyl-CoA carboxylase biotin carboxyl carrier protein
MDLKNIKKLLELLADQDVAEFAYSGDDQTIELKFNSAMVAHQQMVSVPMAAPVAMAAAAPAASSGTAAAEGEVDDGSIAVESPMVGTFYESPSPEAGPFVKVGQKVDVGTTLCIVEAMKLMNKIESEVAGVISEILIKDAQPVQFGQEMFRIRPN